MSAIIIGAGPAGTALAYLLSRNQIEVTLLERETDFERVFRGEGLMPSGVDALLQMGLRDLMNELPVRTIESWDVYIDGKPIFSVPEPAEDLGERSARIIPQPKFLEAMIDRCSASQNFTFRPGLSARALVWDGDRVAGVKVGDKEGTEELRANFIFACDGRGSVLRTKAGLELELLREHYDVAWFKLPTPRELQNRCSLMMLVGRGRAAACYTSWDNRLQFALMIPKGKLEPKDEPDWIGEMAHISPAWLGKHIKACEGAVEGPIRLNVLVGRAHSWRTPGLMLLGDAAHPMSPVRAQGINVALRDSIVAANHFVPVFNRGNDSLGLDRAANAVQDEREPEIVRSQTLQHRDTRGLNSPAAPFLIGMGKYLGAVLGQFDWAKRAWLEQQKDLRLGSTDVRLEV